MDDFADEVKIKERNDGEAYSLIEVRPITFESYNRKKCIAFPHAS